MQIVNGGSGTAWDLRVRPGSPPLVVNRAQRVPRLNADRVDGKHASDLLDKATYDEAGDGKVDAASDADLATNAGLLDGNLASAFLPAEGTAADSDLVDGKHANQLIRAAFGSTNSATEANGDAATTTITAPAAGVLVMSGSIEGFASGSVGFFSRRLTVGGTVVPGTERDSVVHDEENRSTDGPQNVAAGTTPSPSTSLATIVSSSTGLRCG